MTNYRPKVAVIAGVGTGSSAFLARKFVKEGCKVALLARTGGTLEKLRAELEQCGGEVAAISCDLAEPFQITEAFAKINAELGAVDLLVNHASFGGPTRQRFMSVTAEAFERSWRVGVLGGFFCCQAVVPAMLSRGSGCILFTGATSSIRGSSIAFSSSKFALRGLAQAMARELWPQGIHVAHVIIDAVIFKRSDNQKIGLNQAAKREPLLDPDAMAAAYWSLAVQPKHAWSLELDLRPFNEAFYE
ncbi:MAG: SDR family NAD(P)-dependent oxidoreductase [Verrucomicrobia bacterium]|nr:SDR family NAD(P)-dependent oxidoreductase [Verrucomicrobiota bacterium]